MNHLYRHWDEKDNLLYVGISLSAINRLGQHKDNSKWFEKIKKVTIENFQTRQEVVEAEKKAIWDEKPLHNIINKYNPQKLRRLVTEGIENSTNHLINRIVNISVIYTIRDIAKALGTSSKKVEKWMDEGNLSFILMEGRKSGRWAVKTHRKVTGWQFISFIEWLENNAKD